MTESPFPVNALPVSGVATRKRSSAKKSVSGIKAWPKDDRPREKMLMKGAGALSDAELLAILITSGNKEKSALDLARELLSAAGNNLSALGQFEVKMLMKRKGIGEAKAIAIAAALELGRRRQAGGILDKPAIHSSRDSARILQPLLADYKREVFAILLLNRANRVIHFEIVSTGGITGTIADPKVVLKKTLEHNALSIILCHNHPSGSLQPSSADKELTRKIREAALLLDVKVLDHLIVSPEGYCSFADEGLM